MKICVSERKPAGDVPSIQTPGLARVSLIVLALSSAVLLLYATRLGPWTNSDSVAYVVAARNLLAGTGLGWETATGRFMPFYLHPPLFPLLLALVGLPGIDLLSAARVLCVAQYTGLVILAGYWGRKITGSIALGTSAGLVALTSPILVQFSAGAASEPLFFVTGLLSMALTGQFIRERRPLIVLIAAALAGMSFLARYAGVAFVASGAAVLFLAQGSFSERVGRSFAFAGLALTPMALWRLVSARIYPGAEITWADVELGAVWSQLGLVRVGVVTAVWRWIPVSAWLPEPTYRAKVFALLALFSATVLALAASHLRALKRASAGLAGLESFLAGGVLATSAAAYGLVLAGSYVFRLPTPDINDRTISPILVMLAASSLCLLHAVTAVWVGQKWAVRFACVVSLIVAFGQSPRAWEIVSDLHRDGSGYSTPGWRGSNTIEGLRRLSSDAAIVSNETAAILLFNNRAAFELPYLEDPDRLAPWRRVGDGPTRADAEFRTGGFLVLFDTILSQLEASYGPEALARLEALTSGLTVQSRYLDGSIYTYPTPGPGTR